MHGLTSSFPEEVRPCLTKYYKKIYYSSPQRYALRSLKKAGVQPSDLVGIYCALIRSVLEYAAPKWSGLPVYLTEVLEAVHRRALRIIFPYADYNTALCSAGLGTLLTAAMPFALNLYLMLGHHLL